MSHSIKAYTYSCVVLFFLLINAGCSSNNGSQSTENNELQPIEIFHMKRLEGLEGVFPAVYLSDLDEITQAEQARVIENAAVRLCRSAIDYPDFVSVNVEAQKLIAYDSVYTAVVRNPDKREQIVALALNLIGPVRAGQVQGNSAFERIRMISFKMIYTGIAVYPDLYDSLIETAQSLSGDAGLYTSLDSDVRTARMRSLRFVYDAISRNPESAGLLVQAAETLTGTLNNVDEDDPQTRAARMISLAYVFRAIARQPEAADILIESAETLSGTLNDLDLADSEIRAARMLSLSQLYESIARQPEAADVLIQAAERLSGPLNDFDLDPGIGCFSTQELNRSIQLGW